VVEICFLTWPLNKPKGKSDQRKLFCLVAYFGQGKNNWSQQQELPPKTALILQILAIKKAFRTIHLKAFEFRLFQ